MWLTTKHQLNLNDRVWVTLTDEGRIILTRYYLQFLKAPLSMKDLNSLREGHRDRDRHQFQLWELAQIFGERMYNGCKQLFVDNVLEVEHDELVS